MTSPTQRAGADVQLRELLAEIEVTTPGSYVERIANGQRIAYLCAGYIREYGPELAALQARIAELEARNAASERDAAKWRNHVESSDASHTHRCRRCGWNYSPVAGTSEDCPACGFDGVGDAHAQGQAGEGKHERG